MRHSHYLLLLRNKNTNDVYLVSGDMVNQYFKYTDPYGSMRILFSHEPFQNVEFKLELTNDEINDLHEYAKMCQEMMSHEKRAKTKEAKTYYDIKNRICKVLRPELYVEPKKTRKPRKKKEVSECSSQE